MNTSDTKNEHGSGPSALSAGLEGSAFGWTDLVLDNGELIRIEFPVEHDDALHDSLTNAMKRSDWWNPGTFDGCTAEYKGLSITRVNMGRVIGTL